MTTNVEDVIPWESWEGPVDAPSHASTQVLFIHRDLISLRYCNTNKLFMSISFSSSKMQTCVIPLTTIYFMLKQSSPWKPTVIA